MDNIENLLRIKEQNEKGGGVEKIEAQHNLHKLTARERIETLLDSGSFIEIGALVNKNGGGVITGYGTIEGRLVYVFSEDYTVEGGSINSSNTRKIVRIMEMAVKMGAPIVHIFDSVGVKVSNRLEALGTYGAIIRKNVELSGVIPQIAVISGACTGFASISAAMSDFTIIVEKSGELYINTPMKIGEKETKYVDIDMYGDALSASKNGTAQLTAKDDKEALETVRRLFGYLPSNNLELAPYSVSDVLSEPDSRLDEISKEENYDIYEVINIIGDKESFIEVNGNFMPEALTGLMKLNGLTVGVMASDRIERNEGLSVKVLDKLTSFAKLCESFNIPILSLVDTKGFAVSLEEEKEGLALAAANFIYSLAEAKVPKVSLITGEAYGSAYLALASKEAAFDVTYAWPGAKVALAEPEELVKALYREQILEGENPREKEAELIKEHKDAISNPYAAAEEGYIDDIILPSESRIRLFAVLDMLQSKREISYPKKYGSVLR